MTTLTIGRAARAARVLLPALAAILVGCHREPAPPAPASASAAEPAAPRATKLAGAPAHVMAVSFAPDGKSVLVLEERRSKDDDARGVGAFAISRRPTDGGAAVDVYTPTKTFYAPADVVLAMQPLGDSVLVRTKPPSLEEQGQPAPEGEDWQARRAREDEVRSKTALYRIAGGAAPERVSREGLQCTSLVGAAGGQWAAYSLAVVSKDDPFFDGEIHVVGAQPGQDVTLDYRSIVYDISPDGARVLVRRRSEKPDPGSKPDPKKPRKESHPGRASDRVMVSVEDQSVTDLPKTIHVDGAEIDTDALFVFFAGDGLQFVSVEGDRYRSALDGSGATRIAGPRPAADAGAPDASAPDAGTPARPRRWFSPKGTLYELREDEAGAVVLSRGAGLGALTPAARLEGPLSGIGLVSLDADEKRAALVVLSDTSRDGKLDILHDDAEIFLVDLGAPSAAPLGFGRAKVALLADEIRPKIAAAAGLPEASVTTASEHGDLTATAALPWVDGEDAKALLGRMFTAARAIDAALPHRKFAVHVRVGEIDLRVTPSPPEESPRYLLFGNTGMVVADPAALPLVLKDPRAISSMTVETLTGELSNTGKEPTAPIEVYAVHMEGPYNDRKRVEDKKDLGVIQPGKSVKYTLSVKDSSWGTSSTHANFRAGGKKLAFFNTYAYDHTVDALKVAIEAHARFGVWVEHREDRFNEVRMLVRLTAAQAALDDRAREALFTSVRGLFADHRKKFHGHAGGERIVFAAPGGGGWLAEPTKKPTRFEGDAEAQIEEELRALKRRPPRPLLPVVRLHPRRGPLSPFDGDARGMG